MSDVNQKKWQIINSSFVIIHYIGLKIKLFALYSFWNNAVNFFTTVQDVKNLLHYEILNVLNRYDVPWEKISEALSFHVLSENKCHINIACSVFFFFWFCIITKQSKMFQGYCNVFLLPFCVSHCFFCKPLFTLKEKTEHKRHTTVTYWMYSN